MTDAENSNVDVLRRIVWCRRCLNVTLDVLCGGVVIAVNFISFPRFFFSSHFSSLCI